MSVRSASRSQLSFFSAVFSPTVFSLTVFSLGVFSLTALAACSPDKPDSGPQDSKDSDSQTGTLDADNDGYAASEDCDDTNAAINPGATEICNELDDNCDSVIDTDATDTTTYYLDADADGYGVPDTASTVSACSAPEGYAALTDDCDDANAAYHPGADESDCSDPNDYNCDGSAGAVDNDADGFFACEECDDGNTAVNPLAAEVCNDIDDNCDTVIDTDAVDAPTWYTDADSDTYGDSATAVVSCEAPTGTVAVDGDCDDTSTVYNPAADESDCADPNDYNCDGSVGYVDADGDGFAACSECNDDDGAINSSAAEACDGVDNNCDGTIDEAGAIGETVWYADLDGDGYGDGYGDATASVSSCSAPEGYVADSTDCDDTLDTFHPDADESDCTDPADYNCDGSVGYADADGDGTAACEDCDDDNAEAYPGGVEICDGADNDCDTNTDVAAVNATVFYADVDADSYGDASARLESCEASIDGFVTNDTDCDDTQSAYNPAADESDCTDPNDYNCDGSVGYVDADGDGFAACSECNDEDGAINSSAAEACDGVDNDCDGDTDEAGATGETTWFLDADGDTFGDPTISVISCSAPVGYVADSTDCDDGLATFHPDADESDCTDPNDYNCDGSVGYADGDGDGTAACEDCDDLNADAFPGAIEVCDGADNNCDTNTDESSALDATAWYADSDGDTFGDAAATINACAQPDGFVADDTDCDDARDSDFPGADEVCDNHDNDCDGSVDTDALDANAYYADSDDDGYGDVTDFTAACAAPAGYVEDASDCDDAESSTFPGASETCDGVDNDCDDAIDDGLSGAWYLDADGDGYGDPDIGESTCGAPSGYVADDTDCDDADYAVHPDASDTCDGVDTDCNGVVDNNTAPTAPVVSIAPASPRTNDALTAQRDTAAYDADGDALTYSYQWTRDGVSSGTTASIAASATNSGQTWSVEVSASDGCAAGPAGTASVTIANTAPTLASVVLAPDPAYEEDVLTCTSGATNDADGDAVGLSYEWYVNGAAIGFDSDSLDSSAFDRGDSVYCTATPTDGTDDGATRSSSTVTIENSAPSIAAVSITPSTPKASSTLTCSYSGYADIDGDADQSTYAWTLDGVVVGTGSTLSGVFVGNDVVTCTVTPDDGTDSGTAVANSVTIANTAPVLVSVSLTPTAATETSTLTCAPGPTTDADGTSSFSYSYAWTVNGAAIAATTSTLTGTYFSAADSVACVVTPTDGSTSGAAVTSNTVTIANTAPVMSTVSVSPSTGKVGDVLTCAASASDADGSVSYSYAWSTGATGASLTLTAAHNPGDVLTCTATATDSAGATATGTASATVSNTAPVVSTVSVSPSTGTVGDVLTCAGSATDADGGSPTISYAWSTGATGASLTLSASNDPGDVLTCTATATDADGGTDTGSASATVSNTAPVMGTVSISPSTAYNDDLLTCSASATDADGGTPTLTYAWTNSSTGTALGSGATLSLSSATAASRASIACGVTATDANSGTATGSASITLGNRSPVATVSLTPASPTRTSTLSCSGSATDADVDSTSLSFGWTVGGSAVSATSSSAESSSLSGAFSAGQLVVCTVTASDGKSGTDTDTASVTIGNTAPVVSSVTLSPSTVYTSDTLTANVVSNDADGDTLSLTYAWYVGGVVVPAATSSSLSGVSYFSKEQEVYVTVTANDGTTSTALTSSSVTVSNTAPTAPVVEVTPADAVSGDDLTCAVTTASTDVDGDAVTYSFAWDVDGVDYTSVTDSATDSVVDGADVGGEEEWTCEVVAGDGTGTSGVGTDSVVTALGFTEYTTTYGSTMVAITAGSFSMGSATGYVYEAPVHAVTLTHNFWIGQTEVTQGQYLAGMGTDPSYFSSCGTTCPVERVSWTMAAVYANTLSTAEGLSLCYTATGSDLATSLGGDPYTCEGYRLPTEAEWEYVAKAGGSYTYSGSNTVGDVAWYGTNSSYTTHAVASKTANAFGLYDMTGNVWEWTNDGYNHYSAGAVVDPKGPASPMYGARTLRGGACNNISYDVRSPTRNYYPPDYTSENIGFRLVRSAP